jgi:hypothetical protein
MVGKKQGDPTLMIYFGLGYFRDFVFGRKDWSPGTFEFGRDSQVALEKWVEAGKGPGTLTAREYAGDDETKAVMRTRPVCVYPGWAKYLEGDAAAAGSFACVGK